MNFRKPRIRAGLVALLLLAAPVIATAQSSSNDLGSPAETAALFTQDYKNIVAAALPRFDSAVLARRFATIRAKYPDGFDTVRIKRLGDIEQLFGLPAAAAGDGSDYVATADATYGINIGSGRIHFARNVDELKPLSFEEAQRSQKEVELRHVKLLEQVGIDSAQVLFANTGVMSLRTQKRDAPDESAELAADTVFTYALRSIDGVQVEGSAAKLASKGDAGIVSLSLRWPAVLLHPELTSFAIKDRSELLQEILPQVATAANRAAVNVQMAVVLRPVTLRGRSMFVPSLKVGVTSKEEAGAVFYVDLPRQQLSYDSTDVTDKQ